MTDFNKEESAKWSVEVHKVVPALEDRVLAALNENAARGFPAPTGATLTEILELNQKAQMALLEANGKIYSDQRGRIFEVEAFEQKVALAIFKLMVEAYKARMLNQLLIEREQVQAVEDRHKADIQRLNAQTEQRQAAIIRLRADIEHQVNIYKQQLIDAEYITLDAELALVNAKLLTAEKKLEIIDAIYQTIAAEELVQAAERRKADALLLVMDAEERVAAVKKSMIPMQLAKASARQDLAEATTKEAEVREEIEMLGYRRIELKDAEQEADHEVREAETDFERAREVYIRASQATEVARAEARRILQEYSNQVREELIRLKQLLEKDGITFKIDTSYERQKRETEAEIEVMNHEEGIVKDALLKHLINMAEIGVDECKTIRDSAEQAFRTASWEIRAQRITKGTANIADVSSQGEIGASACAEPTE